MNMLIKNVHAIDYKKDEVCDIYIEDGIIKVISENLNISGVEIVDGTGFTILPSFIDTHAHFRDPGFTHKEDIESGSKAALKGGFTGVCLMANTLPICSTPDTLNYVRDTATKVGLVDIHQCVSITKDFQGNSIEHLDDFIGDKKLKAISDDGVGVVDSLMMYSAMEKAKNNDWIVISHAEDPNFSKIDMRIAENIMTLRDLYLANETGAKLHMAHVSTIEAINYIREAKKTNKNITCEVTPHHIYLDNSISNYRVNPPIRTFVDVQALHDAIKDGVVDCIGTDHAPHTIEDKNNGAPGMVGIETAFSICYSSLVKKGVITLNQLSKLMSKNPSDILRMNKGEINIGKDGDLVLVDLNKRVVVDSENFSSKGKNTPFNDMEFYGEVIMTIKSGSIKYKK